jgi:hypothetical protein
MNRTRVAYKESEEIKQCSMHEFSERIKKGIVTTETIVFNNMVQTLSELKKDWEIPAQKSWHAILLA